MSIKKRWFISLIVLTFNLSSQNFKGVIKIDNLLYSITQEDTVYVVNFWATWCKPCIEELPVFDSLYSSISNQPIKLILISLDFKEDLHKNVIPFLTKHKIKAECFLLDEVNGNDFVNKISTKWSGAIPATFFKHGNNHLLEEKKLKLAELQEKIKQVRN